MFRLIALQENEFFKDCVFAIVRIIQFLFAWG
jgi:hypothetical protein